LAELVLGIGMSHSPMVATADAEAWTRFGDVDRGSSFLRGPSGEPITFADLELKNGSRYAAEADPGHLREQTGQVAQSLERLRRDTAEARVDIFVVVGDDQLELHDLGNVPALGVFYGEQVVMATRSRFGTYYEDLAELMARVSAGYGMDAPHRWPGHAPFALHLIGSLLEQRFDVAAMKKVAGPERGIGHAFGVVEAQLMGEEKAPLVPVYVNDYWPPNQLPPPRCFELGLALRRAIEAFPRDLRVAVVASGGLSHFVTDERLDRQVLESLRTGDNKALCALPPHLLTSGSSEIRNWIVLAAACADMPVAWHEYVPVYRTAVGTGCGLAFLRFGG
jgi:catalytic LigB subunit of aromatic ring-opening dioxygenase